MESNVDIITVCNQINVCILLKTSHFASLQNPPLAKSWPLLTGKFGSTQQSDKQQMTGVTDTSANYYHWTRYKLDMECIWIWIELKVFHYYRKYTSGSLSNELVYWSCGLGEFGTINFETLKLLRWTEFFGQVVTLWI